MKILVSLIGLIIFLAGIYLTYWVYLGFESFETLYLGLYLSGSFVSMTLGFYLFLLPLALKPKNKKDDFEKSFNQVTTEQVDVQITEISNTDAIKIVQDTDNDTSIFSDTDEIDRSTILEHDVDSTNTVTQDINEPINKEYLINEDTSTSKQYKDDEVFDLVEVRVIGIESWSSQGILQKLSQDNLLEINPKIKSGITMNQVCFKRKLIGYIPRLDMIKINHKLDRLVDITPSNIVKEGRKIIRFSVNLKFRLEDKTND